MANESMGSNSFQAAGRPREWMLSVITLLDTAIGELGHQEHPAKHSVVRAASLLREQFEPQAGARAEGRRLLGWQVSKVRSHIEDHLEGPIYLKDLCAITRLSTSHFSRLFSCTFGAPFHAFVMQRRLEMAAQHMLETDACLSDIALQCGFADQAHFCRRFRASTGETPAAWRRARRRSKAVEPRGRDLNSSLCLAH